MRVKRYVVDSMPDALQKIRSELGKDAVILNTKEVRSGGFLGLFARKKIEVIAATDTMAGSSNSASSVSAALASARKPQAAAPAAPPPAYAPVATLEPELPPPPVGAERLSAAPKRQAEPKEDKLLEEIRQMKAMMLRMSAQEGEADSPPDPFEAIRRRLLRQEVEPPVAEGIIALAREQTESEEELTAEAAEAAVRLELRRLLASDRMSRLAPDTRIAHFVGPTGVGKTTTIAKLAAEQTLKYNRKVGFITSDTYRIAAVEQLRTYANILNIPLEVVFSPLDLLRAFEQLADRDVIFMDTAGRNFRNEMFVSELNSLLKAEGQSETYLVLSLTAKYKDMKAITENFSKFKIDKVLFTKMDETDTYGSILNLAYDFSLQLSYLTNGQNVPDDIEAVDIGQLIDLIMEEDSDE